LPVERVTWNDSKSLCELLNQLIENGPGFRLPTEAQWEHACQAGTQFAFNDGSECTLPEGLDPALDQIGWFDKNSLSRPQFVKQKPANRWGLYNMPGNVWEWCINAWERNVYEKRAEGVIESAKLNDISYQRRLHPVGVSALNGFQPPGNQPPQSTLRKIEKSIIAKCSTTSRLGSLRSYEPGGKSGLQCRVFPFTLSLRTSI